MKDTTALEVFGGKAQAAATLARQLVAKLTLDSPDEDWIMAEGQVKEAKAFVAELSVAFREHFAGRLLERGDIEFGEDRWYAARETKMISLMDAHSIFEALMEETGGDWETAKRCLSKGAKTWKQSEIREVSPALHARAYEKEVVYHPETGKPKRQPALTR